MAKTTKARGFTSSVRTKRGGALPPKVTAVASVVADEPGGEPQVSGVEAADVTASAVTASTAKKATKTTTKKRASKATKKAK